MSYKDEINMDKLPKQICIRDRVYMGSPLGVSNVMEGNTACYSICLLYTSTLLIIHPSIRKNNGNVVITAVLISKLNQQIGLFTYVCFLFQYFLYLIISYHRR